MNNIKPILSFLLLLSISIVAMGGCQKDSDDEMMREPPPTKSPPTPVPISRPNTKPLPQDIRGATPDWSVTEGLPNTLSCGQQYEVEVVTQESPVSCNGYDYTKIYNRAHTLAYYRIYFSLGGAGSVTCPPACSPVHAWTITRSWSCLLTRASAYVRYGVLCPNPGQAKPPHAPFVTPVPSLSSGNPYNPPNPTPGGVLDSIKENHTRTPTPTPSPLSFDSACPSTDVKYIQYFEKVPSCQNLNYAPIITRAEEWAGMHHEIQSCSSPCRKQAFSVRDKRWKCSGASPLVDVDITYVLNCQRP